MKTTEVKIRGYFDNWEWIVTHYGWKFDVHYCDGHTDMPGSATAEGAMITFANFKYLKANIYVNLDVCGNDLSDGTLEEFVVHELTHLLVSPIDEDVAETPLEYTVTSIARVFLGLRKAKK